VPPYQDNYVGECSLVCLCGPFVSRGMIVMKPIFIAGKDLQESLMLAHFTKLSIDIAELLKRNLYSWNSFILTSDIPRS
jgi:hypothetical protein